MKRRSRWWIWLQVCLVAMCMSFCTPQTKSGGPGSECNSSADCDAEQNLECRAKVCRTKLDLKPPTARARANPESPEVGQLVQLDGRDSTDPQNDPLGYQWSLESKPEGSTADLAKADQVVATFTPDKPGKYSFKLEVTSSDGARKHSMTLVVDVQDRLNGDPIANAGPDQLVEPNTTVNLDGTSSTDPDGDKLTYAWTLKSKPEGSTAKLDDPAAAQPSFKGDEIGSYIVELIVSDDRGAKSSADSVTIRVLEGATKKPVITSVTPKEGFAYELTYAVTIKGTDLFKDAKIRVNTQDFDTTYVSSTELKVELNLALIGVGTHDLVVINPNGITSDPSPFTVKDAPPPKLLSLTPSQGHVGNQMKVIAKGENFIKDRSKILFQSVPLPSNVLSPTEIEFEVDLNNTPLGDYPVKVNNPGNQVSNELVFKVLDRLPKPVLSVLNPPSGETGTKVAFSVHGTSFAQGAVIVFDGKDLPSDRIRRDEIQVKGDLDLTTIQPGEYDVWVRNPDGLTSNKEVFRVRAKDPAPVLNRMLPFNLYLDEVMKDVAVYGQDFLAGAKLYINGKEITGALGSVSFRSDTFLLAEINLTDRQVWVSPGSYDAVVENPNGKKSAPFKVTVTYRVPSVSNLVPESWTKKCDTDVEVHGTNFVKQVQVKFGTSIVYKVGDSTYPLTYVSDKLLKFSLKASALATGKYKVVVENGPQATASPPDFEISDGTTLTPYVQYVRPAYGSADTTVSVIVRPDSSQPSGSTSFKPGAVVELNGKKMKTTCLSFSPTYCYELNAELDLTGLKAGNYDLYVANPCSVRSSATTFTVEPAPKPYITGFQPSHAQIGHKTKITITGANFSKNHTLTWGGQVLKTTYKSDTEIETTDPVDFSSAKLGDIDVVLKNDNGETTDTVKFSVINKYSPTITAITPDIQQRGRVLADLIVKGTGFVLTSRATIGGQNVGTRFISATELRITGYDATSVAAGTYQVQIKNGSRTSNLMPFQLIPVPPPRIDYISPSTIVAGSTTSLTLYIYGTQFSATPDSTVQFLDPTGKDLTSTRWTVGFTSTTYIRGTLNVAGLSTGQYTVQVKNPTGELSNKIVFRITPPPPPTATSINPSSVFRGGQTQRIQIIGTNFVNGDLIIFNNDILNRIPGTSSTSTTLEGTLDLSKIRHGRQYDVYVMRCLDQNCTQTEKTQTLKLSINNPPCALVDCAKDLPNVEKCDTADSVCRPSCTTTADCTAIDSVAGWTCQTGVCK